VTELTSTLHPWHKQAYADLQQLTTRLPHAILLHAPYAMDLDNLAISWINYLLCENKIGACGHCHACQLLLDGSHPDFYRVRLDENDDKKTIGVDKVREVVTFLSVSTHIKLF